MPLQKSLALVGVAKQTVKGTAIAQPAFSHGVEDGQLLSIEVEQEAAGVTSGTRAAFAADRLSAVAGASFTTRLFPKSVGLWCFGALGATTPTGAGPYTHTQTVGSTLPYLTLFSSLAANAVNLKDFMVDELTISWSENEPPKMAVAGMGTVVNFAHGTYTPTTDEQVAAYMRTAGGLFKYDVDSATPATARIKAGEISIKNNVEAIRLSASIVPDDVFPALQQVDWSLTLVPDDFADWRTAVTGTSGGSTVQESPVYGSAEVQFTNGTDTAKFTSTRVPFTIGYPEASADGGPAEIEAAGSGLITAAGGTPLTAVITNSQATY